MINAEDINKAQNKDEMLQDLLEMSIKLYSDGAHFIYELLQNADDTGATAVKLIQRDDCIEFLHNGLPFSNSNFISICNACKSDKKEDEDKIGEFGIGFKSVFAICENVRIYSAPQHYHSKLNYEQYPDAAIEIVDFIKAKNIAPQQIMSAFTTRFIFPYSVGKSFNRFDSIEELRCQLAARIKNLGTEILLFLRHITKIEFEIVNLNQKVIYNNVCEQIVEKVNDSCVLISPPKSNKKGVERISYLKFSRRTEQSTKRTVDIAFPVIVNADGTYEFRKANRPFVSVFFPTATESKLNFLVQGPYQLTPDRSSVSSDIYTKEGKINRNLVEQTVELLQDSILELRDKNKLDISFWQIIPFDESAFYYNTLFRPIYEKIKKMALDESIIPCKNGGYAQAGQLKIGRPQGLSEIFSDEGLTELINDGNYYYWLPSHITESNKTTEALYAYFTRVLKIEVIQPQDLRSLFTNNESFLTRRADDIGFFENLYNLLNTVPQLFSKEKMPTLLTTPLIKCNSGEIVPAYRRNDAGYSSNVFLPITKSIATLLYIDDEHYKRFKRFYEETVHVAKVDEYQYWIDDYKKRFDDGCVVSEEKHIDDIRKILFYMNTSDHGSDTKLLAQDRLLIKCRYKGQSSWCNPYQEDCYFEEGTSNVNIKGYFENIYEPKYIDVEFYRNHGIEREKLQQLWCMDSLLIDDSASNTSYGEFCYEFSIDKLDEALDFIDANGSTQSAIIKSLTIYRILQSNERKLFGKHWVINHWVEECAKIIEILRNRRWLFTEDGRIVAPKEISKYELNEALYGPIRYDFCIYDYLQFQVNDLDRAKDLEREYSQLSEEKRKAYFEQELQQQFGVSSDYISQLIEQDKNRNRSDSVFEFPIEEIKNWEALFKHASELFAVARPVEYARVPRQVRISKNLGDVKVYLKRMYKADNANQYACQMCHNGFDYIEACQIEGNGSAEVELEPLHLCLCPTCATKFRVARNNDLEYKGFIERLHNTNKQDILSPKVVEIMLNEDSIWFTPVHIGEINALFHLLEETRDGVENTESIDGEQQYLETEIDNGEKDQTGNIFEHYIGRNVRHKNLGIGKVISCDDKYIEIEFIEGQKKGKCLPFAINAVKGLLELVD